MAEENVEQTLSVTMHPAITGERTIDLGDKPYVLIEMDLDDDGNLVNTDIQAGSFDDIKFLGAFLHDTGNNVASMEEDEEGDGSLPDSFDPSGRRGAPSDVTLDLASIDRQLAARG